MTKAFRDFFYSCGFGQAMKPIPPVGTVLTHKYFSSVGQRAVMQLVAFNAFRLRVRLHFHLAFLACRLAHAASDTVQVWTGSGYNILYVSF